MEAEEVSGPGLGEAELSTSSLVLIVPPPSSSSAPRTKVYSVASLRSPRLVLTLLRSVQYSTAQHITVQYSTVQYSTGGTSPEARIRAQHSPDCLSSEQSRADTKQTIFHCSGGSCR